MQTKKFNEEVLYTNEEITNVSRQDIAALKKMAMANPRQRIRLCSHRSVEDAIHEMLIIHAKEAYVRPHKHLHKSESFHLIEGSVDVLLFDENGQLRQVIEMGDYASGKQFYFRINDPVYHTLIINSDFIVFHEATQGPFVRTDTIFAPWAPEEKDAAEVKIFMGQLKKSKEIFQ
ncbi:MAG: cupin [Omnitrophica WOR_2 bacterium RIFCSPHIGHO2_01_FULL_48_9]|nr:MAG: cupin [Omnitrophica WOR_2 bacterium RIFCSPHIGHO2_02_FULL_48_11]OGX34407.1 MAG: cupin [Omnitrophica WOR_2 bacterium RIFCSPHIGHO2_01_FULL_48_9]